MKQITGYELHGLVVVVDQSLTATEMKERETGFFFKNSRKGERRVVYKGHIIVVHNREDSIRPSVYAFNTRDNSFFPLNVNVMDVDEAKEKIQEALNRIKTYTIHEQEFESSVRVVTRVSSIQDDGRCVRIEREIVHIGDRDQEQKNDLLYNLKRAVHIDE